MPEDARIGACSERREGISLLTGKGINTGDMALHGQAQAVMVRSAVAQGRIVLIDAAAAMAGVLAEFTGVDVTDNGVAVDATMKAAPNVVTPELTNNRLVPNAMEPRANLGEDNPGTGDDKPTTTRQNPHPTRLPVAGFVSGVPENKLTVVAPDMGGGFGPKFYHDGEAAQVLAAATKFARPARWRAERTEILCPDAHGRDHVTKIERGCTKDGEILAIRTETHANLGAYLFNFLWATPRFLHGTLMAGLYKVPNVFLKVKAVLTNTAPVDACRGAGRAEEAVSRERISDKMWRKRTLDPFEMRRKHLLTPDQFPYISPVGLVYDAGTCQATLDKAIELGEVAGTFSMMSGAHSHGQPYRNAGFTRPCLAGDQRLREESDHA